RLRLQPTGAPARDLGRLRVPRPARHRRSHPAPAREARGPPGRAEPHPDRPRSGLSLPRDMIPRSLRGLRGRLLLALVATSAVTLAVAAAVTLSPLQQRLREQSESSLQNAVESSRTGFERVIEDNPLKRNATSSETEGVLTQRAYAFYAPASDIRSRTDARVLVLDPSLQPRPDLGGGAPSFLF